MNDPLPSNGPRSASVTLRRADTCVVLFALVLPALFEWIYFVLLGEQPVTTQVSAYVAGKVVQFAFPIAWVLAVQRRRLRWGRPGSAGLAESLLFGVIVFAGILVLYYTWLKPAGYLDPAREPIAEKLQGFGLDGPVKYALFGVFLSLAHSFLEEYYWRWFVFGELRRLIPFPAAILVSSLGFMAHHVIVLSIYFEWFPLATALFSLAVAVGGAVWAWIYHQTDSLYGPWLSHLLVDAAVIVVGYDLLRGVLGS